MAQLGDFIVGAQSVLSHKWMHHIDTKEEEEERMHVLEYNGKKEEKCFKINA